MLKNIYLTKDLLDQETKDTHVSNILVKAGDRIRRGQPLISLDSKTVYSDHNGWVRHVAVTLGQKLIPGDLLFIVDVITPNDFRVDQGEFSPSSELGQQGRRGLEREGQRQFAKSYSAPLFDAPEAGNGFASRSGVEQHPYTSHMKEGVPPKMSANTSQNDVAVDKLAEDAANNPELQMQLSQQLKQQLNISPSPSSAPAPTPGR